MKLKPIITSLLDTDLYKFNMNQVIFHKHTDLVGEYHFKCRTPNIFFTIFSKIALKLAKETFSPTISPSIW